MKPPRELNAKGKPRKRAAPKSAFRSGNPHRFLPKTDPNSIYAPSPPPSGIDITPLQLEGLTRLATEGVRPANLRHAVAMSAAVWNAYCAEHPEVMEAVDKGVAAMHNIIVAAQMKKARKGDFMASALILNGRFGYKQSDPESDGGRVNVQVVIPGPLPNSRLIEGATREVQEGDAIPDVDADDPSVVHPTTPSHFNRPRPITNGASDPQLTQHSPAERAEPATPDAASAPDNRLYPSGGLREQHRNASAHRAIDASLDNISAAIKRR